MSDPSKQPGPVDAVTKAISRLDLGEERRDVVKFLQDELGYGVTASYKYAKEACRLRFERDHELGGADIQDMRQRLTDRAWQRSKLLHGKAITCLEQGDETDTTPGKEASNITERGAKLAKGALEHERAIAGYYHLDKVAPDYDLSSEDTREFVARAVATNADAFDTPSLIQIGNAAAATLATRPHLNEEQHREATISERLHALIESKLAIDPN